MIGQITRLIQSSLRKKLSSAMGRDDIAECILTTSLDEYEWKANLLAIVLR